MFNFWSHHVDNLTSEIWGEDKIVTVANVGIKVNRPRRTEDILINFSEYVPQAMGILYPLQQSTFFI